ncbi:MAG: hypothetical protein BWY87_01635 [Deltaproteobacteria bacterium ADurb.Bin510]|nr:MAG: hypothetical protein BWY87_01635 [Deltaproteobacteria bacterium ADurb.Bin510]
MCGCLGFLAGAAPNTAALAIYTLSFYLMASRASEGLNEGNHPDQRHRRGQTRPNLQDHRRSGLLQPEHPGHRPGRHPQPSLAGLSGGRARGPGIGRGAQGSAVFSPRSGCADGLHPDRDRALQRLGRGPGQAALHHHDPGAPDRGPACLARGRDHRRPRPQHRQDQPALGPHALEPRRQPAQGLRRALAARRLRRRCGALRALPPDARDERGYLLPGGQHL